MTHFQFSILNSQFFNIRPVALSCRTDFVVYDIGTVLAHYN